MKLLHTSDWHVGKTLKGRSRLEEQKLVLAETVQIARDHQVDAVLVAGDLYENVAPTADAQKLVVSTLRRLSRAGIEVIAIAGNHDHAATFEAYRPVMGDAGIHIYGVFRPATAGGLHRFTTKTGEKAAVAILPFLSQRYAVRAAEIVENTPAQNVGTYDQMFRDILANLTAEFAADTVNIVMAHLTCTGGSFGGGERAAQSITVDDDLLVVDGPLRGRQHLPRILGYIKSHRSSYLPKDLHRLVGSLTAEQRTPVFKMGTTWERYSWYLRLPCLPAAPWAGVVRLECSAERTRDQAIDLANLSQAVLPRFGSAEYKDARAPNNLYPIAGLERELRRRLGDPRVLYRALRKATGAR